jgi:iron complex outermembrane recepter protein
MGRIHSRWSPMTCRVNLLAACALLGLLRPGFAQQAPAGGAAAEESGGLQEVIVTATRRSENVQNVPETVSVLTGADLEAKGLDNVAAYSSAVPGLSYNQTGFGDRDGLDLTIRGISNTRTADQTAGTGALTTGFYIDDVAVQPVDMELYDMNRMEVLKGPQGTLFGQASMGGTIRLFTNKPDSTKFEAGVQVEGDDIYHGSQGGSVKGFINIPLIDGQLALRAVGYDIHEAGWINWQPASLAPGAVRGPTQGIPAGYPENPDVGARQYQEDVNTTTTTGARLALSWTPLSNLEITPFFMYQTKWNPFTSEIDRNLNEGYVTQSYIAEPRREQFNDTALTINYDMPFGTLTSVTAEYNRDYRWTQDTTTFCSDTYGLGTNGGIASTCFINFDYNTQIKSQELRLASHSGQYFDWLVGGAVFHELRTYNVLWLAPDQDTNAPPANQIPDNGLVYATSYQLTYRDASEFADLTLKLFNQRLQLTAGERHFTQYYDQYPQASTGALVGSPGAIIYGAPQTGSESGFTPRFSAKYALTPQTLLYATMGKGFRGGGPGAGPANTQTTGCLQALEEVGVAPGGSFKSDHTTSSEVGFKFTSPNNKVLVDAALFYTSWNDLQASLILNNFVASCGDVVTTNGGKAYSKGAEMSASVRPIDSLTLSAALTYTDARLGTQPPASAVGQDGYYLQNAPIWQSTESLQYNFPIMKDKTAYFRTDFSYYGWQYSNQASEASPFFYVPARTLLNLRLGLRPLDGPWSVEMYVNNLQDRIQEYGAQQLFGDTKTNQTLVGPPLSLGALLSYKW